MTSDELEVATGLVRRLADADPIVAAVVAEAAHYAPHEDNEADRPISSSRLFLGAIYCGARELEEGPLRDLRRALEGLEAGPAALSQLRTHFEYEEGSAGTLDRLRAGLTSNASNLITTAGADGRVTEEALVNALLTSPSGRLPKRMREFGVDFKELHDAYSRIRRSAAQPDADDVGESGDAPQLERLRLAGLAAYDLFYRGLQTRAPDIWLARFSAGTVAQVRASMANLPAPDEDLALRVLVSLAYEVRSGSLEYFYRMPPDGGPEGTPVSEPLRLWLSTNHNVLTVLFPEVLGKKVGRVWESWKPPQTRIPAGPGRFDWETFVSSATDLTRHEPFAAVGTSDHWLLFILIRDSGPDLWRLLNQEAINRATTRILQEMDASASRPSLSFLVSVSFLEMRQAERDLAGDLPVSAWTIFATLIIRCPKQVADTFGREFTPDDAQRILQQAREALALPSPDGTPANNVPDEPPRPDEVLSNARPEARATRDFWTANDSLGYQPFADAIAGFIRHKETRPPFTIGIKAPWGSGKTSLMRMVQHALDPRENLETWKPKDLKIDPEQRLTLIQLDAREPVEQKEGGLRRVMTRVRKAFQWSHRETPHEARVWDLLDRITRPPAKDAEIVGKLKEIRPTTDDAATPKDSLWRPTVWFNPWMYQTGEQTWAGLANDIINQISDRLDPVDREWFWLQLNLRRVNRESVRRRVHAAIFRRLIPGAIVAANVLLLTVLAWLASDGSVKSAAATAMPLSPLGFLLWGGYQLAAGLRRSVSSAFPDLVEGPKATEHVRDLIKSGAEGLGEAFEDPGYAAKMGFLYLIQTDMKRVLDLVATKEQPLVVFVDDLDRCSPGTVAQVIEAVNLFLAGEFPNCIFVLAMEPDIVAAHVEVEHEALVTRLGRGLLAEEWTTLGWRFLDKIVQLPLSIPEPDGQDKLKPFLDGLLGPVEMATADASTPSSPPPEAAPKPLDDALVARYVKTIEDKKSDLSITGLRNAAREAQAERPGAAEGAGLSREAVAAARQVFEVQLSERNPAVRRAIESGIDLLGPRNPRQVKRFINLFRFYAFIEAVRTFSAADDAAAAELTAIAKVVAIAIRWPSLVTAITRKSNGQHILDVLEQKAGKDGEWNAALQATGLLGPKAAPAEDDPNASSLDARRFDDLRRLLATGPRIAAPGRRLL